MEFYFVCIAAMDHPRLGDRLTVADYVNETHVVASFGQSSQMSLTERRVTAELKHMGLKRRIAAYIPSILALPDLIASTDMLGLVPRSFAIHASRHVRIRMFDIPLDIPRDGLSMVWHPRTTDDPAHKWMRGIIRDGCQSLTQGQP